MDKSKTKKSFESMFLGNSSLWAYLPILLFIPTLIFAISKSFESPIRDFFLLLSIVLWVYLFVKGYKRFVEYKLFTKLKTKEELSNWLSRNRRQFENPLMSKEIIKKSINWNDINGVDYHLVESLGKHLERYELEYQFSDFFWEVKPGDQRVRIEMWITDNGFYREAITDLKKEQEQEFLNSDLVNSLISISPPTFEKDNLKIVLKKIDTLESIFFQTIKF